MRETTVVKFHVDTIDSSTDMLTQYGMRYPDGSIRWETDGSNGISFQRLASGQTAEDRTWSTDVNKRAAAASIDPDAYRAQHRLVKRTIVLAIMPVEEI